MHAAEFASEREAGAPMAQAGGAYVVDLMRRVTSGINQWRNADFQALIRITRPGLFRIPKIHSEPRIQQTAPAVCPRPYDGTSPKKQPQCAQPEVYRLVPGK